MNKTRKHFPGGIRNKIFLLILGTVVLLSAAFFGVTTYRNNIENKSRIYLFLSFA